MNILDYSDDILELKQAIFFARVPITDKQFNSLQKCMDLVFVLDLLKEIDCPIDDLIQSFIRANFNFDTLRDIESKHILPLLGILGYEVIKGDDIPDDRGMWKAGFRKSKREWIRYSDEIEPYGLLRELYLELLKDFYASKSF